MLLQLVCLLLVRLIGHTEKLLHEGEEKLVVQILTTLQRTSEQCSDTVSEVANEVSM